MNQFLARYAGQPCFVVAHAWAAHQAGEEPPVGTYAWTCWRRVYDEAYNDAYRASLRW